MAISREINGVTETIELTKSEMERAATIVRENDLISFAENMLMTGYPAIWKDVELREIFISSYLHEWLKYDSTDDIDVFNIVLEELSGGSKTQQDF